MVQKWKLWPLAAAGVLFGALGVGKIPLSRGNGSAADRRGFAILLGDDCPVVQHRDALQLGAARVGLL